MPFFAKYLQESALASVDEGTLRELIYILWSFNGWTNKDWLLQEMLSSGLPVIRKAFKQLLYGSAPLAERFDFVKDSVRMMGAASVSEILAHHDRKIYPIWNRRSRQGLINLGINEHLLPRPGQISGLQYTAFCKLVQSSRDQIAAEYPEFSDLFDLDFFLYFASVQSSRPDGQPVVVSDTEVDFDHGTTIDQVLELGDGLGFEVQKEFSVMRGCRIDAIWRSRVANLGTIAYAFEVHRRGSRDSAILNLQRVKRDPTIQRVIVVSSKEELKRFKDEIASLDENFRNSVGYFDVQDLQQALAHLQDLKGILRILGLLSAEGLFE